jgi:hypothetical protein
LATLVRFASPRITFRRLNWRRVFHEVGDTFGRCQIQRLLQRAASGFAFSFERGFCFFSFCGLFAA